MKEAEAADIILGQSGSADRFVLKWHGITFRLKIQPITARGLIEISREICHVQEVNTEKGMFPEQMSKADNLKYICRAIAISTRTRARRLVAKAISELSMEDIYKMWAMVIKQSDPSSFFFIMVSAKGMNQLKTTKVPEESGEGTPSSADSH